MSGLPKLLQTIKKYHPRADLEMVELAYDFANEAHRGQKRVDGSDYISHPLATAQKLAEMKLNAPIIIAGLLHDVPEETKVTLKEIEKNFGQDVASMVEGITKLGKIKYRGIERYIENLRKMFIAMARDLRVVIIKFADRLHNLQTLEALPPHKRLRIAQETLEIFAPIANRLGIGELKGALEDEAFRYVYPEEYKWVEGLVKKRLEKEEEYLKKVIKHVKGELTREGIKYISVHGRTKHFFSLYKKLLKHDRDINQIHDLIAVRIVVKDLADCYATLGIVHKKWKPLKGHIKDYIAQPKPNGYRSLHTTVFCEDGEIIEIQIRTAEIHEETEFGIAAHWHYDESGKDSFRDQQTKHSKNLKWIGELARWQKEIQENQKHLEELKIDVFQTRIFVFTPKGDVIDLPENSTPVDFAYHVHTELGNKCVGAMVNDQMASLDTKLSSGDVVKIILDKNRKGPSPDWLNFVKTNLAKHKIRSQVKHDSKVKQILGKIWVK
jgi:GTP pyrophosphokinase